MKFRSIQYVFSYFWMISLFTYQFLLCLDAWTVNGLFFVWNNLYLVIPFLISFILGIIFTFLGKQHHTTIFTGLLLLSALLILIGNMFVFVKWLSYLGCFLSIGWIFTVQTELDFTSNSPISMNFSLYIGFFISILLPSVSIIGQIADYIVGFFLFCVTLIFGSIYLRRGNKKLDHYHKNISHSKSIRLFIPIVIRLLLNLSLLCNLVILQIYAISIWRVVFCSIVILGYLLMLMIVPKSKKWIYHSVIILVCIGLGVAQSFLLNGMFTFLVFFMQSAGLLLLWIAHFLELSKQIS